MKRLPKFDENDTYLQRLTKDGEFYRSVKDHYSSHRTYRRVIMVLVSTMLFMISSTWLDNIFESCDLTSVFQGIILVISSGCIIFTTLLLTIPCDFDEIQNYWKAKKQHPEAGPLYDSEYDCKNQHSSVILKIPYTFNLQFRRDRPRIAVSVTIIWLISMIFIPSLMNHRCLFLIGE